MKLAIYVPHGAVPDKRGFAPAIVAWNHARRLKSVKPIVICAREDQTPGHASMYDISIHRIGEGRFYRRFFRKITRFDPYPLHRRAAKIVNHESSDLLHAHQLEFPIADFLKSLKRKIPVIVHAHVTAGRFEESRGAADRYLAVSQHVKEKLTREKNFPAARVEVLPNGVDTALFSPPSNAERAALRRAWNVPLESIVVSFVGRKQEVKGFHVFLKTVEVAMARHKSLYVLAAGAEPKDSAHEKTFGLRRDIRNKLKASGRYAEFPAVPHAQLAEILKMSDILLAPSLSEPQGMVMLESMACGCVTISANVEGIKESITHGTTGFLLNHPDNPDEALAQLEHAIAQREALDAMRQAARQTVMNRFDWDIIVARLEKIYWDTADEKN